MPNQKPTSTASEYGAIISVDSQVRGPRGATKSFIDGLLALLSGLVIDSDACIIRHADYRVARADFPANDAGKEAWKNARQALAARLKSHHEELVRRGDLPAGTRLSINWFPDNGHEDANRPQCSLKKKA